MTSQDFDINEAHKTPREIFKDPEAVLLASGLEDEQKRRLLQKWEWDERELAVAAEEGMGGGEINLLQRVRKALRAVGGAEDAESGSHTKHGT